MKKEKNKKEKKESFFKKVRKEMKEVKWPSRKDMIKYSVAVLTCIIVLSVFFTLSDLIIAGVRTILEGL